MDKRDEIDRKTEISRVLHDAYYKHIDNKKIDMDAVFKDMIEGVFSITNRVRCPECKGQGYFRSRGTANGREDCPSCTEGWITVDVEKMYEAIQSIKSKSDRAYVDYVNYCGRAECQGQAYKIDTGKFKDDELQCHQEASKLFGKHLAYMDIYNQLKQAIGGE